MGGLALACTTTENTHVVNCNLLKMEGIMIAGNCSEQFDQPLKMKI